MLCVAVCRQARVVQKKPDIEQVLLLMAHHTCFQTVTMWVQMLHCTASKCQCRHINGEYSLMESDAPAWLAGAPEGACAAGELRAAAGRKGEAAQASGIRQCAGVPAPPHPEPAGVSVVSLCVRR